jgi:hypothetical protein
MVAKFKSVGVRRASLLMLLLVLAWTLLAGCGGADRGRSARFEVQRSGGRVASEPV